MTPTTNGLGAAGAGGAVAVILVWLVNTFAPTVEVTDPVAQAFAIICIIVASYIIPAEGRRRRRDYQYSPGVTRDRR